MGTDANISDFMNILFHLAFPVIWMKNPHLPTNAMGALKH
jgi:hypothetical protein